MIQDIKTIVDENGNLAFFEAIKDIPFEMKRIYFVYSVPNQTKRGMHAHKNLHQFLWVLNGSIKILLDDGITKNEIHLDSPKKGIIIGPGVWHDMYWETGDAVLCVAASDYYDESDYIRNYDHFIELVNGGYWKNENKL